MPPPTEDLLDRGELDTWLARALLSSGRLSVELLRQGLQAAREGRGAGGSSLARRLVSARLCQPEELVQLLSQAEVGQRRRKARSGYWDAGLQVADYRLEARLGAGGMGEVWRATHLPTGAERALKVLALQGDPEAALRFQREGQSQARVGAHPNVIAVHEVGVQDGRAYLAMDVAPEGNLSRRLASGPLAPRAAAELVVALGRGLAHVHAEGVLHRDLKPDNVLFRGETPLLADFGLAKLLDERSLTATGAILGTPSYMAPEQIDPSRGAVDERSDVYGLGAILYHCLTGQPPFVGPSAMAVLVQVTQDAPRPPSAYGPVPRPLEAICLRALAKDMQRRPPSAQALVQELSAFLSGEGGARPVGLWAGVAGAALLLGGLGWALVAGGAEAPPADLGGAARATGSPEPASTPRRARPRTNSSPARPEGGERSSLLSEADERAWRVMAHRKVSDPHTSLVLLERLAALGHPQAQARLAYLACVRDDMADPAWGLYVLLEGALAGELTPLLYLIKIYCRPVPGLVGIERDLDLAGAAAFLARQRELPPRERQRIDSELAKQGGKIVLPSDPRQAKETLRRASEEARLRFEAIYQEDWSRLDQATSYVGSVLTREQDLLRAARRGRTRAWGELGRAYLLDSSSRNVARGVRLLALAVIGGDRRSGLDLGNALLVAHEFHDPEAKAFFRQGQTSSYRGGFDRPRLVAQLFAFARDQAGNGRWGGLAAQSAKELAREGFHCELSYSEALREMQPALRELEAWMWRAEGGDESLLDDAEELLLSRARAHGGGRVLQGAMLRLLQRDYPPAQQVAAVRAQGSGDPIFANAGLLELGLQGYPEALQSLVKLHLLDRGSLFSQEAHSAELAAACVERLELVARTSIDPAQAQELREKVRSARGELRRRQVRTPSDPLRTLREAFQRARGELEESQRALSAQATRAEGAALERLLETLAGRGRAGAFCELARCRSRGTRGVALQPEQAYLDLRCAVLGGSQEAALLLGCAATLGLEGVAGEARAALSAEARGFLGRPAERALGLACLLAAREGSRRGVAERAQRALEALAEAEISPQPSGLSDPWDLAQLAVLESLRAE